MNIFLTGGTGFVGRHFVLAALRAGHDLTLWVRTPAAARELFGDRVRYVVATPRLQDPQTDTELNAAIERADAVVHLAGATVFRPWTPAYRRELVSSRVELANRLVAALGRVTPRQRVMITASGVGAYGEGEDRWCDEESPLAPGFLAELCRQWEAATLAAEAFGVRTVALRIGLVLGREGGFLRKMLPLMKLGLAARFGDGSAYVPWIHIRDLIGLALFCLETPTVSGVLNAVAPTPEPQAKVLDAIATRLNRKVRLAVPKFVFGLLGEQGAMLTDSQRVRSPRVLSLGYPFAFTSLEAALDDLLVDAPTSAP